MKANDTQEGGIHYMTPYQPWDFFAKAFGSGYFKASTIKYVARWRLKNGMEDLKKARHYLIKLTELVALEDLTLDLVWESPVEFIAANSFYPQEAVVIDKVTEALDIKDLNEALEALDQLIDDASGFVGEP